MRPSHLSDILEREFLGARAGTHTPVMIWGPPGVGKSQIVAQVAARHQAPVIDVRLSQMEPSDLRGIPFRAGEVVQWAPPAMLPSACRHGIAGVLFLDEINAAPPSVSAAAYQLILDRRLGEYQVPGGWAIFAAGNRQGDRGVTYTMPSPLANRFTHFDLDVNLDDWVLWAHQTGVDARITGFLRYRPELLFDFDPARHPIAFPSPRSWEFAHRALQKFGDAPGLLPDALRACVGEAAGVELHAFLRHIEKLPDIDAILAGEEIQPPREVDLQYAVAAALVARVVAARDTPELPVLLGRVLAFAGRFELREMGVMLVSDLSRSVGQPLFAVPEFKDWARLVADVMLYTG